MRTIIYTAVALFAVTGNARAEIGASEVDRLSQAAAVARESRPLIPDTYWNRARCVAVVPDLKKAAFIVGGEYGKGVMSCRSGDGWSAPVFLQLARGSWGFQAGAEEVDLVMLVMNESGVQKLLRNNISLGADASVAAGPIGRQANAGTDASLTAEILAYSRAKGLFAGVNLSGGVLRPDDDSNRDAYGRGATPSTILATRSISAPTQASPFLQALESAATPIAAATTSEPGPSASPAATANASAPSSTQTPARSANTAPDTDSDLRVMIVAMQQSIDNMLMGENTAAVGTSGQTGNGGPMVSVSRERLIQLRKQLDTLLAALNARGQ
jgi:lipid-binding SYLF domain-containing protein